MSNQTLENMRLIVLEMRAQLFSEDNDFKAIKTLSHSYETLLNQVSGSQTKLPADEVKSQLINIKKINGIVESKSIPELLSAGDYVAVNHLTTTTSRLNLIINALSKLLNNLYRNYNTRVAIVSKNIEKAESFMWKLIEANNEEAMGDKAHPNPQRTGRIIYTDKHVYEAWKYGVSIRGRRVDFVYIDNTLPQEDINNIIMCLKDKNNVSYF